MLSQKSVNTFGFVAVGLMALMLVLIWARLVPHTMYLPLFLIAAALFLARVTLRLVLARQERVMKKEKENEEKSRAGTPGPL
jgi:Flp pilus assembly protein TadB